MKKSTYIACILILLASGVFVVLALTRDSGYTGDRLYHAVRNHVMAQGNGEVALGELTDFEWDKAMIFGPVGPDGCVAHIKNVIGVEYNGRRSSGTTGIIFVKDEDIVYYEAYSSLIFFVDQVPPRLSISIDSGLRSSSIFFPEDIFSVGMGQSLAPEPFHWLTAVRRCDGSDDFE